MNYGKKGVRAKQKALNAKSTKLGRKVAVSLVELSLAALIGLMICGISIGIGMFRGILSSTPPISLDDVMASGEASIVYDNRGNEIDQYVTTNSNRIPVNSMDLIPENLAHAFVAIEDKRFYQHNGIDLQRIVGVGILFIQTMGKEKQGASTITQQLLKNTIFTTWTEENGNMIKMIKRKLQEQYLALETSKHFTKDEVLLRYMNAINLGQNTLGVEAASQRYFGKSCSELTLSECAVIASITQNPSGYNPISHPDKNARRRKDCLDEMLNLEFISETEYNIAMADTDAVYERIKLHNDSYTSSNTNTSGTYFSDALYEQVKDDLINIAGYNETMAENLLTAGGLRIESTMDPEIQAIADEEFANPDNYPANVKWYLNYALTVFKGDGERVNFSMENMMTWFRQNQDKKFNLIFSSQDDAYEAIDTYRSAMLADLGIADEEDNYVQSISMTPQPQAAMVIEDQSTGYIVALVGGRGAKEGRRTLNRATSAKRSPGSTFKVVAAFAPALDSAGQTLATVYIDAPFNYSDGKPVRNYYKTGYRGINPIREGIRESMNIIAVKTLTVITPQLGYDYLLNFGFTTLVDSEVRNGQVYTDINQSLAIGGLTWGATPYEVNGAYAAIANMGTYATPKLYSRVTNAKGDVILDNTTPVTRQVIKETTAYLLTSAMVDVVATGTGTACRFNNMAIAGKTGTSTDYHDVWFAGFTPYYTCTVWAGYDNNIGMITKRGDSYEIGVAKSLWRNTMKRVHENLPNKSFTTPPGIVRAEVCRLSGLLPIPGLCAAHGCVYTEYFAEGTVPTQTCNVHYEGYICEYDLLPASPNCPFPIYGTAQLPLVEDPSLLSGSTMVTTNPDGTTTYTPPNTTTHCLHDDAFFANPDYQNILNAQTAELEQRRAAAAAEAAGEAGLPPGETGAPPAGETGTPPAGETGAPPTGETGTPPAP